MNKNKDVNPWAGLSSYEDPAKAEREGRKPKLFCGRDDESYCFAQLVNGNIFVTLYGKSGTGKTSLLNAGVFPLLREKRYLPISIRLSMDALDITFQQCIIHQIEQSVTKSECHLRTVDVVPLPADEQQPNYIWSYFARTRITDKEGRLIFPVIVLDQFEEVFRNRRRESETLLRQIAYLMDESHALSPRIVDSQLYRYDFNFRFIVSIREDDLYCLEDSIDYCYLLELKRCRYRLRSLSEKGAYDAILIPGQGLFEAEEVEEIASKIIKKSRNEDDSISTIIISLLCSRIFADFLSSKDDYITTSLVDSFLKGNPFERFYNDATRGLSNREKSYIEEHLIDSSGRRNSISESDLIRHIAEGKSLLVGENRILQRISSSDGKNNRVELIHDSFCEPLKIQRQKRLLRRRIKQIGLVCMLTIAILVGATYIIHSLNERQQRMLISQSLFLSEKASTLVEEGDAYTARLLALEALPKDLESPSRPYTPEAEAALRNACYRNSGVFVGHTDMVTSISYNEKESLIVSASADSTIKVWDAGTGTVLYTLRGHTNKVNEVKFSPDNKWIASSSSDKTIRLWDVNNKKCKYILQGSKESYGHIAFTSDSHYLISESAKSGIVDIWNVITGKRVKQYKIKNTDNIVFSADATKIASCFDKSLMIWDAKSGALLHTFKCPKYTDIKIPPGAYFTDKFKEEHIALSNNGKLLAYANMAGRIYIMEVSTGKEILSVRPAGTLSMLEFIPGDQEIVFSLSKGEILTTRIYGEHSLVLLNGFASLSPAITYSSKGNNFIFSKQDNSFQLMCMYSQGISIGVDSLFYNGGSISQNKKYAIQKKGKVLSIYDFDKRKVCKSFYGTDDDTWELSISNNGGVIAECPRKYDNEQKASWQSSKKINVYDTTNGTLKGVVDNVDAFAFSCDSKNIICGNNNIIRIIQVTDLRCKKEIDINYGKEENLSFESIVVSPDSKTIVTFNDDGHITLIDVVTERIIPISETSSSEPVFCNQNNNIAFISEDGKSIIFVDSSNGSILKKISNGCVDLKSIAFNTMGSLMITTDAETCMNVWDVTKGKAILSLLIDVIPEYAFFSSNDSEIIVEKSLSKMEVFPYPPLQQLINETRDRFKNRQLSPDERRKYYLE